MKPEHRQMFYRRLLLISSLLLLTSCATTSLTPASSATEKPLSIENSPASTSHKTQPQRTRTGQQLTLPKQVQYPVPAEFKQYHVSTSTQLYSALAQAMTTGNSAIYLTDGVYHVSQLIRIRAANIMLLSKSGNPNKVVLSGQGMRKTARVNNLIKVEASGFVLDGITLKNTGNHLIQIAAEKNVDYPVIRNCILQDSYEQLLKVSYGKNTPDTYSDYGLIEYCRFEYTQGIGPNYYIGGVDAHGIRNWIIRHNLFRDIASPGGRIAEHAIHIWSNSSNNTVDDNIIIDSDRGIGFGMQQQHPNLRYSNSGGVIKNNYIYHSDNGDPFADVGIILEDSQGESVIENNKVYLGHHYPNAIEYRFPSTNAIIKNNHTNKHISSRDDGRAELIDNRKMDNISAFTQQLNQKLKTLDL